MKRIILTIALILFLTSQAWAAWDLTASKVSKAEHYLKWKVVCTCDGAALAITDLLPLLSEQLLRDVQGETLMLMKVSPGTAGVAPDNVFTVTLSDGEGDALYTEVGVTHLAISWHDLGDDIKAYIPVMSKLYLTITDIGTNGDQVTLYFIMWIEEN